MRCGIVALMLQRIDYAKLTRSLLARGYTTKSLGVELGLSQPSVSRLANGLVESVSADVAFRLIKLVGGQVLIPPEHATTADPNEQAT
jgi:transcriptional regulator with XRE-family HTH domain